MDFYDLLAPLNVKPEQVLIMRHAPRNPKKLREALPRLAAERPNVFNAYQQHQNEREEKILSKSKYLASFVGHEPGKAKFVGLYERRGDRRISREELERIPEIRELRTLGMGGNRREISRWFDLEPMKEFEGLKLKLVINWPGGEKAWCRRAAPNKFRILQGSGLVRNTLARETSEPPQERTRAEFDVRTEISEAFARGGVCHDFLFTWKPEHWSHDDLYKLVESFQSTGSTEEKWRCAAHKKILPGDRAYLLKQGKPIGIFGRGTVIGKPEKVPKALPGQRPWRVLIRFEASQGDVLWDPEDQFLVDEGHLLDLPTQKKQWQNQASGITLEPEAARAIDSMILDSILIGRGQTTPVDEHAQEVARQKKLIEQLIRPDQQSFSNTIRRNYQSKCAVTGCVTAAALEAAHIRTQKAKDDNNAANGILLRSDIHALFDRFLITLTPDGMRMEVSPELTDPSYASLRTAMVARPQGGPPPSAESIREHRNRFLERLKRRSGNPGKGGPDLSV